MPDDTRPEGNEPDPGQKPEQSGIVPKEELDRLKELYPELPAEKLEALSKKLKGYDAHLYKKSEEYSQQMKALSEREQEVKAVAEQLAAAAATPAGSKAREEAEESFDSLIENTADPQSREGLRKFKSVLLKEMKKVLESELKEIKSGYQEQAAALGSARATQIEADLDKLREVYGDALIDKHSKEVIGFGSLPKYHGYSAKKLLYSLADSDALEQALRVSNKKTITNGSPPKNEPITSTAPKPLSERYKIDPKQPKSGRKVIRSAVSDVTKDVMRKLLSSRAVSP